MIIMEDKCLSCGEPFDSATEVVSDAKPGPGDITICLYCGHLMAFGNNMKVRALTDAEMLEIAGDKDLLQIQQARGKIMKPRIENVYCFPNGMVAVTDQHGQQIPEYQGRYDDVWPKIQKDLQPTSKIHR